MRRQHIIVGALCALASAIPSGCRAPTSRAVLARTSADQHYRQVARRINYGGENQPTVVLSEKPRSLRHPTDDELWHITQADAVRMALANTSIIRTDGEFLSNGNRLLNNPESSPSALDPAIQNSSTLSGSRGTASALADFDPRISTSMTWNRDENVQNNLFLSGGLPPGNTLAEETADFNSRIEKVFATGTEVGLVNDWSYSLNNAPGRLFGSAYSGVVGVDLRQPLWAGFGTEFTQIAGPVGLLGNRANGIFQGVVISKIDNNMSVEDFEAGVRQLVFDVGSVYWELYLAIQVYEIERTVRDSTLATWEQVKAKLETGVEGGGAADEAQAGEEYFATQSRTELALASVWETEARLRRLLGLPANDGRLIRPADSPVADEPQADWSQSLAAALSFRNELRKQKLKIRSLELQLKAAKSLINPHLDFVAGYRVNAFGDQLYASNDNDGITAQGHRSAVGNLLQGDQTGWEMGFVYSMPLGVRAERAQAKNLELRLAKARSALAAQELEISHELTNAFNQMDRWYTTAQTNAQRKSAADRRVNAFEAEYETGRTSLDLMLRARISRAQSQIEYQRSLVEYNKALANVRFRNGTIMETYQIRIAELHPPTRRSDLNDEQPDEEATNPLEERAALSISRS